MHAFPLVAAGIVVAALGACAASPVASGQQFVEVHGSRLSVETFGRGAPIVFLHGGLHHFDNSFGKQQGDFAATRQVIGIDQRGHGHSPDDGRPFSYAAMAEDTAAVIGKLGLGAVDVVGHSDGANVGLLLARAHPELVRRLVISGANLRAGLPPEELRRRADWSPAQMAEFLVKFEQKMPPGFRKDYEAVAPGGPEGWNAFLAKTYRLWLTPVVIDAADLKAIRSPVLVIAGDKDFAPLEDTAEIYRGLSTAQLLIVPGAGHATFSDKPELVDLAIRQFLDKP